MNKPWLFRHWLPVLLSLLVVCGPACLARQDVLGSPVPTADFRYAPAWWQTAICLPDDPDKILVGKEGQLLLDFGGGGVRNFGLSVRPEIDTNTTWIRQETLSGRVPIVETRFDGGGLEILEEAFVVPPREPNAPAASVLRRLDGTERLVNWAQPRRPCVADFSSVDVGYGGKAIRLQLPATNLGEVTVIFGLCEGWHKQPGQRPLTLAVEGSPSKTVDPVKDFGPNQPGLYRLSGRDENHDGVLDICVATPEQAPDRNAILNLLRVYQGKAPPDDQVLSGASSPGAVAFWPAPTPPRTAVLLVTVKNNNPCTAAIQPALQVQSLQPVRFVAESAILSVGSTHILSSLPPGSWAPTASNNYSVSLRPLDLPPGRSTQFAFGVERRATQPLRSLSLRQALRWRDEARRWWEKADLPFDVIHVPDKEVQAILESCVRNIWQAREIKHDQPAFHVGPTVYRGLWVVDGSFLLETAALLGRAKDARAGVEYLLSHQKADGSFDLLGKYWKENGIVLWAAARHALLTQDKTWLRTHWPALQRVVNAIERLRREASTDSSAPCCRLLPPGTIDGGIGGSDKPEYSNTYWCLAGLKAAVGAARWLGDETNASAWEREFEDFYSTWRKRAESDLCTDQFGNRYVPTLMGNLDHHVPARGQWAFCHAVYPGEVFRPKDQLVENQLSMLGATKVEGMVYDTGWMREGIWTYFASFYGHALLWDGHAREAADVLYAFAQHAAPTRVWREEQKPRGHGNEEVGDMPHNWASAEFIRLTVHLLELDRGNELHLLEGFPRQWARPGMVTRVDGVLTPFGPLRLEVRISQDGSSARVRMARLSGRQPSRVVLHLAGLKGCEQLVDLPVDRDLDQRF